MNILDSPATMLRFRRPARMRVIAFVVLQSILCLSSPSVAHAERLPIKSYTSADGLGSSFVNYLMRDSRGFMWFCTRDGLSRFDGTRFVTYTIGDRDAPPGIEGIAETRDGSYWIGTTGGLYRFKRDAVSQPDSTNGNRPRLNAEFIDSSRGALFEDRNGSIWYAAGGALFRLEESDGKIAFHRIGLDLPPIPNRVFGITSINETADGSIWMDTSWGLLRRLPDERLILYRTESTATQGFRSFVMDGEGRIWYVRALDFYVIKPETLESLGNLGRVTVKQLNPTYVLPASTETEVRLPDAPGEILKLSAGEFLVKYPGRRFCKTSDNHVWLTTEQELIEFDGRVFHRFTAAQGLPVSMSTIAEDSAGNLWIGGPVLIRLDRRGLISYGESDGFHAASIHAINEAKDGTLYFADGEFYLAHFAGKALKSARPAVAGGSAIWWTSRYAFLDSRNEWWILTSEKLYRFSAGNFDAPLATYTSRDGLKADAMFQIYEDRFGDIWVSVQPVNVGNNGLARFDRSKNKFHSFTEAEGFPAGKSVSAFAEDKYGNLWMGFYEGGMARYANGRFTIFKAADGLPAGLISDLLIDRKGRLWLSSSGAGVGRVDDPGAEKLTFASLTTADGLSSNNIRTIAEDHLGNIYLGTVRGIDRISAETNLVRHYSVSDGLAGDFVVDSHCDRNGVLWFATMNGLSRLEPAADEPHETPAIWLGGLRIAGVQRSVPELGANELGELELSYRQNNLQLDFFALDFHAGETLRYQYRLEGADADWSLPTEERTITFPNLRPGTYRFLVRAVGTQGISSEHPASVSFRILPPIWFRWWFITLLLLIAATIATTLIWQRTARRRERERASDALRQVKEERLRELEQMRRRIAADLHDDIGSNLTRISLISEVAQRRLDGADPPVKEQLSSIGKLSRELVDSMSEIVWAINPNKDHLGDLSQRMRHFASDLLTARQVDFRFRALDFDRDIKVGANVRREFFLIFKEAVNNIARHSTCTEAEIELRADDDNLVLTVGDNGKGFDPDQKGTGHGLVSMRERTRSLGGELQIRSAVGQGTVLAFVIPLHHPVAEQGPTDAA